MFAAGAGAGGRQSLGTTVFGGMVAATTLTLVFVPVFYALIEWARRGGEEEEEEEARPGAERRIAPPRAEAAE
jgi:HAE1 family hydrophobic/amphiphilic exporter-1